MPVGLSSRLQIWSLKFSLWVGQWSSLACHMLQNTSHSCSHVLMKPLPMFWWENWDKLQSAGLLESATGWYHKALKKKPLRSGHKHAFYRRNTDNNLTNRQKATASKSPPNILEGKKLIPDDLMSGVCVQHLIHLVRHFNCVQWQQNITCMQVCSFLIKLLFPWSIRADARSTLRRPQAPRKLPAPNWSKLEPFRRRNQVKTWIQTRLVIFFLAGLSVFL